MQVGYDQYAYQTLTSDQVTKLAQAEGNSVGTGVLAPLIDQALTNIATNTTAIASSSATLAAATSADTPNTIVKRDGSGHAALVRELPSVAVANLASGGSVGSAATTVDIADAVVLTQTTASQTVTFPNPTSATPIRRVTLVNVGTASVTFYTATVAGGAAQAVIWTGTAWVLEA